MLQTCKEELENIMQQNEERKSVIEKIRVMIVN